MKGGGIAASLNARTAYPLRIGNFAVGFLNAKARGLANADLAFGFERDGAGARVAGLAGVRAFAGRAAGFLDVLRDDGPLVPFSEAIDSLRYAFANFSKRTVVVRTRCAAALLPVSAFVKSCDKLDNISFRLDIVFCNAISELLLKLWVDMCS